MRKIQLILLLLPFATIAQQLQTQTHTMEYDNLNRLTRVVFSNGTVYEYTYDNLGNRLQRIVTEEQQQELTFVPDDAFEQELINFGYDDVMDDYVVTANISDVVNLPLQNGTIEDMTGIEDFDALQTLTVSNNNLTELSLTENTNLEELSCGDNNLVSLDISQNVNLVDLSCADNQLTNLDISNNTSLQFLFAGDNQLQNIDLSNNISLREVFLFNNPLDDLDVSSNTNLEHLDITDTNIVNIDINQNPNLIYLDISDNNINEIDLSQNLQLFMIRADNTNIETLNTSSNPNLEEVVMQFGFLNTVDFSQNSNLRLLLLGSNALVDVDLSNNSNLEDVRVGQNSLETLNMKNGNNENITSFYATANNTLFCIEVDDEVAANNGTGVYANWNVDAQVEFSEECASTNELTFVPDNAFEQKLIDDGYDDVLDDYVLTANISGIETFSLFGLGVSDLTGIEDFSSLTFFTASNNQITETDLSQNSNLSILNIGDNLLTSIELGNIPLTELIIDNNQLTSFDASSFPQLNDLRINNNNLFTIDVINLNNLNVLHVHNNPLDEIDLSGTTNISWLSCFSTDIQILDLGQQTSLSTLHTWETNLTELNLRNGFNQDLVVMTSTDNPNLECIQVDDEVNANAGNGIYGDWNVDPIATFSEDCESLSVDDNELSTIVIFPNPTDGLLHIEIPHTFIDRHIQYQVLDVIGRRIINGSIQNGDSTKTINMKELSAGNYFLKFISDNKVWTTQIIKK